MDAYNETRFLDALGRVLGGLPAFSFETAAQWMDVLRAALADLADLEDIHGNEVLPLVRDTIDTMLYIGQRDAGGSPIAGLRIMQDGLQSELLTALIHFQCSEWLFAMPKMEALFQRMLRAGRTHFGASE